MYDTYQSPLASRNASPAMLRLWSARHKFNMWRRIWLAAAEAMHEVGKDLPKPLVTKEQVDELRAVVNRQNSDGTAGITDDEIRLAEKYERELRHDVMAHVHALGDACPKARPIIHLGMTSQDVVCNADLLIFIEAIGLVHSKGARVSLAFGDFSIQWKSLPALAMTHYQPAQPTTVGRRAAMWGWDCSLAIGYLYSSFGSLKLKGLRGATGTQASYLQLFGGDGELVDRFEQRTIQLLRSNQNRQSGRRFDEEQADLDRHGPVGQTYPRIVDQMVLSAIACVAAVLHKIATDIRLLCNRKELDEPFEDRQIGSSAMPYKRNPMRCERICGLTRFVMNLVGNAYDTAATQWLERTLDDSSNRRLSLPEAFLALDGALDLMHNVASGLVVHEAMVRRNLMAELPFLATEHILMECVKLGGDRQDYHERIRVHAQAAGMRVKSEGLDNDLIERLRKDPAFRSKARGGALANDIDWDSLMDPMKYIGRSVEQTERFLRDVVEPMRRHYCEELAKLEDSGPRV